VLLQNKENKQDAASSCHLFPFREVCGACHKNLLKLNVYIGYSKLLRAIWTWTCFLSSNFQPSSKVIYCGVK